MCKIEAEEKLNTLVHRHFISWYTCLFGCWGAGGGGGWGYRGGWGDYVLCNVVLQVLV